MYSPFPHPPPTPSNVPFLPLLLLLFVYVDHIFLPLFVFVSSFRVFHMCFRNIVCEVLSSSLTVLKRRVLDSH